MVVGGVGWRGMVKMVVQRSMVWVVWREPPRDSMRCWAWKRPSWDEVAVLAGRPGSMGLVHMHSRVLSSVSMVRMVVLEGYVPGRVVDELDSVCTGVMMSTVSGMARAIQRRMRLVAPDVG